MGHWETGPGRHDYTTLVSTNIEAEILYNEVSVPFGGQALWEPGETRGLSTWPAEARGAALPVPQPWQKGASCRQGAEPDSYTPHHTGRRPGPASGIQLPSSRRGISPPSEMVAAGGSESKKTYIPGPRAAPPSSAIATCWAEVSSSWAVIAPLDRAETAHLIAVSELREGKASGASAGLDLLPLPHLQFTTLPIDTAKVRLQLQGSAAPAVARGAPPVLKYKGMFGTMKTIASEEGMGRAVEGAGARAPSPDCVVGGLRIGPHDPVSPLSPQCPILRETVRIPCGPPRSF